MQKKDFKKFAGKVLLFLLPFICAIALELFVFPIDAFTFRPWEALSDEDYFGKVFLPGPFYPNYTLTDTHETGDLGSHTPFAVKKVSLWQTDQFGYRKTPAGTGAQIVLVGDSFTVGSGLTQQQTLTTQLQNLTHEDVYPFASEDLGYFLSGGAPDLGKPKVVVLEPVELNIAVLRLNYGSGFTARLKNKIFSFKFNSLFQKLEPVFILADRVLKENMYHSLKAGLDNYFVPKQALVYNIPEPTLFYQQGLNTPRPDQAQIDSIAAGIAAASQTLKQQGIRFIFMPIPEKETVYWQDIPGRAQPTFLPDLIAKTRDLGVETIDLPSLFTKQFEQNQSLLYQTDDTHWDALGVQLAAQQLAAGLQRKP